MSAADLKTRLADVPGIETLTMGFEAGRIALRWGAYVASVDATSSDHDIEMPVRAAIKLPPATMVSDKPAPGAAPAQAAVKPMSFTGAGAASHSLRERMPRRSGSLNSSGSM
jgi:hypothetical protein